MGDEPTAAGRRIQGGPWSVWARKRIAELEGGLAAKAILNAEREVLRLNIAIRKVWHTLDEAPAPGWITQDMRDAIVDACKGLKPLPWQEGD